MKLSTLTILAAFLLVISSCTKKSSDTFVDKLTFGTSYSYTDFTLTGEGSTFSATPGNVAFRLESSEDFNNNPVKFVIKKDGVTYSTDIYTNNPKPTGHLFLTMKNYSTRGSYSVTAYIQKSTGDKTVASGSFQMN
jgi:hypothetical protein